MQISDMLGQYNRNTANGTEELKSAQGVQRLASSVRELSAGSVFEGTVNYARNGKVTLALGNGQLISARLDGKVDIKVGSSMFFQVRSNDGATIAIRPYSGVGNASNPILLNALTAAQIPVTDRSLTMVDAMMREQMSIDKQSLLDMIKVVNNNQNSNVQTIVQMMKLGMPVSEAMANQFENYLTDRHALLNEMELVTAQIAETLGDETLEPEAALRLYDSVMRIFESGGKAPLEPGAGIFESVDDAAISQQTNGKTAEMGQVPTGNTQTAQMPGVAGDARGEVRPGQMPEDVAESGTMFAKKGAAPDGVTLDLMLGRENEQVTTIENLLSKEQMASLAKTLQNIPALTGNTEIFAGEAAEEIYVDTLQDEEISVGVSGETVDTKVNAQSDSVASAQGSAVDSSQILQKNLTAEQLLQTLQRALTENHHLGLAGVQRLFAGKEFQILLKDMAEQQWLIKPQDLKLNNKIENLYERLEAQIRQMETAVRMTGIEQSSFLQTAADIRGNIEFMNQMNQIYNYVQIPLKMSGQNANGELYVYSNRKRFTDPEAEVTAFLHLDMENLGSTDVSVRMQNRQVKTNFYLEDDASYDLLEKHLPILEKRLKNKGYNCQITVTNEKKNINFTENFVKKGQPQTSGQTLHRYSFDVRA